MGSPAEPSPAAAAADVVPPDDDDAQPPELSEEGYLKEVLHVTAKQSEAEVVDELVAKASALGIATSSRPSTPGKQNISSAESATTDGTRHARTLSTDSAGSHSTALTAYSFTQGPAKMEPQQKAAAKRAARGLSFSQYDEYLKQVDPNLKQPKLPKAPPPPPPPDAAPSLFSVSTRKSFVSIKKTLRTKVPWKRRPVVSIAAPTSCICCREEFDEAKALHGLPCGHTYCAGCLHVMVSQSGTDESKMPPRCCTQPIPGPTVRAVLAREEQQAFLKAVLQFSTPWEARIFCPNTTCGEFIPPRSRIDPKHPFDVVCRACRTPVCVMCKRHAHPVGRDCPEDWELEAVVKLGEKSGWRRCYKCRTLVELSQGCTHMTCRCKAQFCYICGAVWDGSIGCPNFCNGEEEMERRILEEERRLAELEAEKAARDQAAAEAEVERLEAERRTEASADFKLLRREQEKELERFRVFEQKTRWVQWSRHSHKKLALVDKHRDQAEKMRERHVKTAQHLEDRQIAAEMELRTTLEQSERSVKIRLKHMEAYCDGLGRHPDGDMPQRVVTERDLRELGQQYNVRDGMERLHQARINVMRDRQAKATEELLERQEAELHRQADKREEDLEDLAAEFAHDEDALSRVFQDRRAKMLRRWELETEILRRELEVKDGVKYGPMAAPDWPAELPRHKEETSPAEAEAEAETEAEVATPT